LNQELEQQRRNFESEQEKYNEGIQKIQLEYDKASGENKQLLEKQKEAFDRERQLSKEREAQLITSLKEEIERKRMASDRESQEQSDLRRKYEEAESKIQKKRNEIKLTVEFHTLAKNIEKSFENLEKEKDLLDEHKAYLNERSTGGTVVKGIFSLGIHSIFNSGRKERLEGQIREYRKGLRKTLDYYSKLLLGEKHPRNDEV